MIFTFRKPILYLNHVSTKLLRKAIKCNFPQAGGFSFLVNLISSEFIIYPPSLSKARLVAGLAHGIMDTFPKHLVQLRIPVLLVIPLEDHQTISVEMV